MKRNPMLLLAALLFLVAFVAGAIEALIVRAYLETAVMGAWTHFIAFFGLEPVAGPREICLDYCAPPLPFLAGLIGLTAFGVAWLILVTAWWRSKR
nr:hypothetical protein [Sphingomonas melonis]